MQIVVLLHKNGAQLQDLAQPVMNAALPTETKFVMMSVSMVMPSVVYQPKKFALLTEKKSALITNAAMSQPPIAHSSMAAPLMIFAVLTTQQSTFVSELKSVKLMTAKIMSPTTLKLAAMKKQDSPIAQSLKLVLKLKIAAKLPKHGAITNTDVLKIPQRHSVLNAMMMFSVLTTVLQMKTIAAQLHSSMKSQVILAFPLLVITHSLTAQKVITSYLATFAVHHTKNAMENVSQKMNSAVKTQPQHFATLTVLMSVNHSVVMNQINSSK